MSFTKGSDNPHNYCTQLYTVKHSYDNTEYEFFRERIVDDANNLKLGSRQTATACLRTTPRALPPRPRSCR